MIEINKNKKINAKNQWQDILPVSCTSAYASSSFSHDPLFTHTQTQTDTHTYNCIWYRHLSVLKRHIKG